jgi:hypothetical protein
MEIIVTNPRRQWTQPNSETCLVSILLLVHAILD